MMRLWLRKLEHFSGLCLEKNGVRSFISQWSSSQFRCSVSLSDSSCLLQLSVWWPSPFLISWLLRNPKGKQSLLIVADDVISWLPRDSRLSQSHQSFFKIWNKPVSDIHVKGCLQQHPVTLFCSAQLIRPADTPSDENCSDSVWRIKTLLRLRSLRNRVRVRALCTISD